MQDFLEVKLCLNRVLGLHATLGPPKLVFLDLLSTVFLHIDKVDEQDQMDF